MEVERFETQREFNNKFPSKFYVCSNCGKLLQDKYTCCYCGWRADGLFKTMDKGYKFIIEEQSEVSEVSVSEQSKIKDEPSSVPSDKKTPGA